MMIVTAVFFVSFMLACRHLVPAHQYFFIVSLSGKGEFQYIYAITEFRGID
jgi:hypothetical protein